jgi:P4 family phage/plasmid primase-like protien
MQQYKDLTLFLKQHTNKNVGGPPSHTRIADKELNIYGGAYCIPPDILETFHRLYCDEVFTKKRPEYLTEKQLEHNGPILVDFDFRYEYHVDTRQHTIENIQDMVILYLEELKEFFVFNDTIQFNIFIMEKPHINQVADKKITKDGIHMLIGIQMDHTMQLMLRERVLKKIADSWENLPLTNNWDSVLDEGISKGTTNWQLFGSRKPGNEAYEVTQYYSISLDKNDNEFCMNGVPLQNFNIIENFIHLSAQNANNPKLEINSKILGEYNKRLEKKTKKTSNIKINIPQQMADPEQAFMSQNIPIEDIVNKETLSLAVNYFIETLLPGEIEIKEIHEYTQILPAKYYESGSHLLNRRVAFALKHTDDRLFLSWVMLRSKASDFDYSCISSLYQDWNRYFNKKDNDDTLTKRSIIYWAKQDAYEDYIKVKETNVNAMIDNTLFTNNDFDFALVLHYLYKDKYVCTSITNKTWYVFKGHRWEPDRGMTIRLALSKEVFNLYQRKITQCVIEAKDLNHDTDEYTKLMKKSGQYAKISEKLKKTGDKNNIIREAMELFYDKHFVQLVDSNKFLLCFNNGVIDFTTQTFRDGYPQDYITKTTGNDYIPYVAGSPLSIEIIEFMKKLFPDEGLNTYMWQHLASCLIGTNLNQTFNIYRGSGSNGKSILTDLMTHALGEYKGTVPITLVTEKRNTIGGTSSEIIQLKGIRYAVMQEPSKDAKINEGVMKEITGGDPVQGRALYCESEIFEPQFKLVVCTNTLFEINSNDDGTWRRIRICDFMSKFVDEGEEHTDNTAHIFVKDKSLKEKLPKLAPVFVSMLVNIAFTTNGAVQDCDMVLSASKKYRQGQDHISAFVLDKVIQTNNKVDKIKKNELSHEFKKWFEQEQGSRKQPKGSELNDYMDKRFGKCLGIVWVGVKINYPDSLIEGEPELL